MTRNRIDFWLDDRDKDDLRVMKVVANLKLKRSFAQTVKDGIMVMNQLRKKNTDLLFKLHPWIVDKILLSAPPSKDVIELQKQIADLRKLVIEQGGTLKNPPADYPAMKQSGSGIGTLGAGRVVELPRFDDDDAGDTIVLNRSTGSTSNSHNLMAGIFGLD